MSEIIDLKKIRTRILGRHSVNTAVPVDTRLIYVLEGSLHLTVLEKKMTLGEEDVVVINSGEPYSYTSSADALFVVVPIPYELLRQKGRLIFGCNSTFLNTKGYDQLRKTLKQMIFRQAQSEQKQRIGYPIDFAYVSEYFKMVDLLASCFSLSQMEEPEKEPTGENRLRRAAVEEYLYDHYADAVSLRDLAGHLALSEAYLSRWLRQNYGYSFSRMLRYIRLTRAMEDLLYSEHTITRIAIDNGFHNVAYFTKVFKEEYQKSPTEYRNQIKGEAARKEEESDDLEKRLVHYVQKSMWEAENNDFVLKNTYEVETQEAQPLAPIWNQLLNAGNAALLLQSNMQERLTQLKEALGFQYIRIWSILSKDLLINVEEDADKLYFGKLDQVIDFILRIGAKPFIDFEEKARRVNQNAFSMSYYEANPITFASVQQFGRLLAALLRHWLKRYGAGEVGQWKIEVWYDGVKLKGLRDSENYFTLFSVTWEVVKKYVPTIAVGGSGIFPEYALDPSRRRNNFWQAWQQSAPRPDFISQINFAYESEELHQRYSRRSMDEGFLQHAAQGLKQELAAVGWDQLPIYITEWNLTVSDRNYMNDSCFQASYIVKNVMDVCSQVQILGYFHGCDLLVEYYDSNRLLYGGSGLMNGNGILKPAAYAIQFLNMLYPFCCGKGENYFVTKNMQGSFSIICHNLKALNHFYYAQEENEIDRTMIWKCFDDQMALHLSLILKDVENGAYHLSIQRVNEHCGSILNEWQNMNYKEHLSQKELQHMQAICIPGFQTQRKEASDHRLSLDLSLEANEIALIRIERYIE